jgi:tetratricopeptide (TPR) repeat protein
MRWVGFLRRVKLAEHIFVLLILLIAGVFGFHHQYETEMPSAVGYPLQVSAMIAAGKGFVEPVFSGDPTNIEQAPELGRFLREEREALPFSAIPPDLETRKPGYFWVYYHQHMYYTIGWLWRVFGISWEAVRALRVLFLCIMAVSMYGIFRFGIGRMWSLGATLALLPYLMPYSFQVRDFSPGAFILPVMFLLGYLLTQRVRTRRFLGIVLLLGVLTGVGIGFRTNVMLCLAPAALVICTCARPNLGGREKRQWMKKGAERAVALALLLSVFAAIGWPVLKAYRADRISAHDFTKGLATVYDDNAGVGRASYERVYKNNDAYAGKVWETYAIRDLPVGAELQSVNDQREVYMRDVFLTFPGDMLTRAYVSILWVLRGGMTLPPQQNIDAWKTVAGVITAFVLMLVAARNLRLAVLTLMLLMYFCGYLSLQAAVRHGFHLAFVPLWILGFLIDNRRYPLHRMITNPPRVLAGYRALRQSPGDVLRPTLKRMPAFLAIAAVIVFVPLYAARSVQAAHMQEILQEHENAALEPVAVQPEPLEDWVIFRRPLVEPPPAGARLPYRDFYEGDYYVVLLDAERLPDRLFIKYETVRGIDDYSQGVWIPPAPGNASAHVQYFIPVYERAKWWLGEWSFFAGIALPEKDAGAFRGLYRVRNVEEFSFIMNMMIPPDAEDFWSHQQVFGHRPPLPDYQLYTESAGNWIAPDTSHQVPKLPEIPDLENPHHEVVRFQKALEASPEEPLHWLGLGAAWDALGQDHEALQSYREALALNPRLYVVYEYVEDFFRRRDDKEGLVAQWRTMAFFYPDLWLPQLYLGRVLVMQGHHAEARQAFVAALDREPCHIPAWYDLLGTIPQRGGLPSSVEALVPVLDRCNARGAAAVREQLDLRMRPITRPAAEHAGSS